MKALSKSASEYGIEFVNVFYKALDNKRHVFMFDIYLKKELFRDLILISIYRSWESTTAKTRKSSGTATKCLFKIDKRFKTICPTRITLSNPTMSNLYSVKYAFLNLT